MKFIVKDFKAKSVGTSDNIPSFGADSPEKIYTFYKSVIESDPGYEVEKEHFVAICLNTRLTVTGWHMVSIGSLSECTCHPREIFRPVIVRCSHTFVLAHNHPSGDPEPSEGDLLTTKRLVEAGKILEIEVVDHIIVTSNNYLSFKERKLL